MKKFKDTIVIKMGGSLLIPDQIDIDFLKHLKELIKHFVSEGYQIAMVVGGGKICRKYQAAARAFDHITDIDLDWIGIKTIHLNCELLRSIFSDIDVYNSVVLKPENVLGIQNSLIIVGAWEPGRSSDTDAVEIAKNLVAKRIINFSNLAQVYSSDPDTNPDAKPFDTLTWNEYRNIIPADWIPGMSVPLDPIASKMAQENEITIVVLGASIKNLENYLKGEKFEGTVIK